QAERVPALDEADRVGAREEGVHVLRRLVLDLRDKRREVWVGQRRSDVAGHGAAVLLESGREVGRGLRAETVVRVREEELLLSLRREVIADRVRDLVRGERRTEDVRALARRLAVSRVAGQRVASGVGVDEDQL